MKTAWTETVVLLAGLEWVLWTDSRHVFDKPVRGLGTALLVLIVVGLLLRQRPTPAELGFAPASWFRGLPILFFVTALAMAGIAWTGNWLGTIGNVDDFAHWLRRNWHLEGVQQLLLQVLLVPRLRVLFGKEGWWVSATAAIIFGLLHAPNVPLVILTTMAGMFWCEWFRRFANLPALWLSHLLVAATLLYCANTDALGTLRVGISYLFRH